MHVVGQERVLQFKVLIYSVRFSKLQRALRATLSFSEVWDVVPIINLMYSCLYDIHLLQLSKCQSVEWSCLYLLGLSLSQLGCMTTKYHLWHLDFVWFMASITLAMSSSGCFIHLYWFTLLNPLKAKHPCFSAMEIRLFIPCIGVCTVTFADTVCWEQRQNNKWWRWRHSGGQGWPAVEMANWDMEDCNSVLLHTVII